MGHFLPQVLLTQDLGRRLMCYPAPLQICLSKQRTVVFFRNAVKHAIAID